jgi:RloB-like protein
MARKIKIDNSVLKRFAREQQKRRVGGTPIRKYFLIVCEGVKTEPNYFEAIKNTLPIGVIRFIDIEGEGKNTLTLIEETVKIREREAILNGKEYDQTWAVFDRDSFPEQNFNNAINKGEGLKNKVNCAWTNEAFELWYLLHIEFVNVPMSREDYKPRIENWLTQKTGTEFKDAKNRPDMYSILKEFGNEKQAILWAEQLEKNYDDFEFSKHNPCTKVHKLVAELNELK